MGRGFVWDSEKATSNALRHGVRLERAREVFLDQWARYEDACPNEEARQACIGLTVDYRLLYVVHVIQEGDVLRLISARVAEAAERTLIRAYISNGLRAHVADREAQWAKDSTMEESSQRLMAHGVPERAIQEAVAEVRAGR